MSDTTESNDERPCLHCLIGDVIDDFYDDYGSLSGEKDTIDVDEIVTALAKTVAEMTFGSDAALRQRILEDLMRGISTGKRRAALSADPSALSCRSDRGHQHWRPIGSFPCEKESSVKNLVFRLASASMTLASTAKPSPLTRPAAMQARTTASNTWRKRSLSRKRPWRLTEKVE